MMEMKNMERYPTASSADILPLELHRYQAKQMMGKK
jgi:hypothetical protein